MKRILHIDSSPRSGRSHSRKLTLELRNRLFEKYPDHELVYRDLNIGTPPHVDLAWIEAAYSDQDNLNPRQKQALEISNSLIDEFLSADIYLMGVPMYNFGMPSVLKAYLDNIVRIGRTFLFDPEDKSEPYKPLTPAGRKMYVVIATGDDGFREGEPLHELNHLEPHIKTAFGFIGVTDIHFIYCGNDEYGGEKLEQSVRQALEDIEEIVEVS
jgi:FMN-dependent NADH-azoreductase